LELFAGIRDPFSEGGENGFRLFEGAFLCVGVSVGRLNFGLVARC